MHRACLATARRGPAVGAPGSPPDSTWWPSQVPPPDSRPRDQAGAWLHHSTWRAPGACVQVARSREPAWRSLCATWPWAGVTFPCGRRPGKCVGEKEALRPPGHPPPSVCVRASGRRLGLGSRRVLSGAAGRDPASLARTPRSWTPLAHPSLKVPALGGPWGGPLLPALSSGFWEAVAARPGSSGSAMNYARALGRPIINEL